MDLAAFLSYQKTGENHSYGKTFQGIPKFLEKKLQDLLFYLILLWDFQKFSLNSKQSNISNKGDTGIADSGTLYAALLHNGMIIIPWSKSLENH